MDLQVMARELEVKRAELQSIFQKAATGEIDPVTGAALYDHNVMNASQIQEIQRRNEELNDLDNRYAAAKLADIELRNAEEMSKLSQPNRRIVGGAFGPMDGARGGNGNGGHGSVDAAKWMGINQQGQKISDFVFAHVNFKARGGNRGRFSAEIDNVDVKTLLQESSGYAPANPRTNIEVQYATRRPMVGDLIPTDPTDLQIVKWMEETTFTSAASMTAEAGLKQESALAWTERTATVQKIATWIPVTEEQVDDVPGLMGLINRDLSRMLLLGEEDQLLNGDGNSPHLLGFLQAPNVQSQSFVVNNADTIFNAFTKVRYTGFAEPGAVVMHPNNWQTIRLMKTTGSGEYILGDPQLDVEARLFGKPVVVTPAIGAGTALTGDFAGYSHISRKMGLRIDVSDSHDTYFIYNKLAIRAEMREALEIRRQSAFCKMSGLT